MKVLIVDDDADDKFLLHNALVRCGVQNVAEVSSAEEARKFIAGEPPYQFRRHPDLIFVDVKMAGSNGLDFVRWMNQKPEFENIPIIVLSGSIMKEQQAEALSLGARAIYEKPGEHAQLVKLVEKVLQEFVKTA